MNDCLSREEIELLNKRELRGERLVNALKHLETCESCRQQIKLPSKEELLRRIFDDENEIAALLKRPVPQTPSSHQKK